MEITVPLIGFAVGILIGMTGMGGGALMTPALILVAGVSPLRAVGSDLVFAAVTKLFGAREHLRIGSVDMRVVSALATGSVPAALISVVVLGRYLEGEGAEQIVLHVLGWVLLVAALLVVARGFIRLRLPRPASYPGLVATGAVVGALVGLTSVGSGTLIVAALTFTTGLSARAVVGTDIVHALVLTAVAATAHLHLGTVDLPLTFLLLLGSIPGVVLGSRITLRVPDPILRGVLATVLLIASVRLQVPMSPHPPPTGEAPPVTSDQTLPQLPAPTESP